MEITQKSINYFRKDIDNIRDKLRRSSTSYNDLIDMTNLVENITEKLTKLEERLRRLESRDN